MQNEYSQEELVLRDEVEKSERVLDGYERELKKVNAELEELAGKATQFDVLSQACRSLEELDALGAAHLFWNGESGTGEPGAQIRSARQRIEAYSEEIERVEARRDAVLSQINDQNEVLDFLHYDLQDAIDREESRKNEWLIEREASRLPARSQVMPWARGCEEDRRFQRSLLASVAASLAIAALIGVIAVPVVEREAMTELPERVAKLVREERTPPPPPEPEPLLAEEEIPEPEPVETEPPEDVPEAVEQPVVADAAEPDTREQVKSKGILAFRDSFANRANLRPTAQLGSQARVRDAGRNAVGRPERMMVATTAPGSSGGINLSDFSREVGGGGDGLEGVALSRVESSIGGAEGPNRPLAGSVAAGRTDEEIQIVFDRYKAALYRLYNRELRRDPTLRGQMVLRLTIEPDGSVSFCQVQSSDMDAPTLAEQVIDRVRTFDFGAKEDVVAMTIIYPIDFLPAA